MCNKLFYLVQLKCVGGTAGCHRYKPRLVNCKNVGFDGYDVQVGVV